jgi:hypothetical protein
MDVASRLGYVSAQADRGASEICREPLHAPSQGIFVIRTPEFIHHHSPKTGHKDLLATHNTRSGGKAVF